MVFHGIPAMGEVLSSLRKFLRTPACCLYLLTALFPCTALLASDAIVTDSRTPDGLLIENEQISLKIYDRLFLEPALKKQGRRLSLVSRGRVEKPAFYIRVG